MKIRTDFVTNSSSSSFVVATIATSSTELCELMQSLQMDEISAIPGCIQIESQENDYGFRTSEPTTPRKLVMTLLEMAEVSDVSREVIRQYSDSIITYKIEVGHSAYGDNDGLDRSYIDALSKEKGIDPDELWDVLPNKNGMIVEKSIYTYEATKKVKKEHFLLGPLDNYVSLRTDGIFGEEDCEELPDLVYIRKYANPVLEEILKQHNYIRNDGREYGSYPLSYDPTLDEDTNFPYYGVDDIEEITKSLLSCIITCGKADGTLAEELVERFEEIRDSFTKLEGGCASVVDPDIYMMEGYDFELIDGEVEYDHRISYNGEW